MGRYLGAAFHGCNEPGNNNNTAFPRRIRRKLAGMCEGVGPIRENNRVHIL
jgi:hypothetical protein